MVSTSTIARSLKRTLDKIITDDSDGYESKAIFKKWCNIDEMEDNYHDDLEVGGPGLASETPEATEFGTGDIKEGYLTRYMARKFGLKIQVTQEALDDGKYDKVIMAAKRLKRSLWKTADIDATSMLIRATSSSYVGGDGVSLASASHTLPLGGTFSNTLATPMSPSRQAVTIATTMMRKFPGHDGVTEGVEPVAVLHPLDQWSVWEEILRSTHAPEAGEFNRVNVVNSSLDIKPIPIKYWNNTTTKFAFQTDCDYGLCFKWRKRPSSNSWKENGQELTLYSISARWSRGWSDPRCIVFSDA